MEFKPYQGQVAPTAQTGNAVDTLTPQLLQEKANAIGRTTDQIVAATKSVGNVFDVINSLNQQSELTRSLDAYRKEQQKIMTMITATPSAIGSWAPDEAGNTGDNLQRWHDNQVSKLSGDLKGRYADEFITQTNAMALKMEAGISEFALTAQRKSIAASDANFVAENLAAPDTSNPEGWVAQTMDDIGRRYAMGVENNVYTPEFASAKMREIEESAKKAVYTSIASDIQDEDGWNHPTSPRIGEDGKPAPYIGFNGALDFIEDLREQDLLSDSEARMMEAAIDEQDQIRSSRGSKIQAEYSQDYIMDWTKRIVVNGERPSASRLLNDPRVNAEITNNYRRNGDSSAAKYMTSLLDNILNPTGSTSDKRDWNSILSKPGGKEAWELYHKDSLDNLQFSNRLLSLYNNVEGIGGIDAQDVQWINDKSRDRVFNDNYVALRKEVEDFYAPQIKDEKNDAKRSALEAQMRGDVMGLLDSLPDDASRTDVLQIIDNYKNQKIGGEIFKDYIKPDPRKTNYAEQVLSDIQAGKYMGLGGIPRFAEEINKVAELHRQMVAGVYGEENIVDFRYGVQGTPSEGRVSYLVKDPTDNMRPKWIRADLVGKEEVLKEFSPLDYDERIGEVWNPAQAPVLLELEAEKAQDAAVQEDLTNARVFEVQNRVALGTDYQSLLNLGYTREELQQAGTKNIPGAPDYRGELAPAIDYYRANAENGKISLSNLKNFMMVKEYTPEMEDKIYEFVWNQNKDAIKSYLKTQEDAGEINLQNDRGGRRRIANFVFAKRLEDFGLPREYMDTVYEYVFGGE